MPGLPLGLTSTGVYHLVFFFFKSPQKDPNALTEGGAALPKDPFFLLCGEEEHKSISAPYRSPPVLYAVEITFP